MVATTTRRALDQQAWMITVLLLVDSLHFVFARLLVPYISPTISAFYVQGVSTVVIGIYAIATGQLQWSILRRHFWFFVAIGTLIGVSTNISYTAFVFVDPGTAALLGQISIIFGLGFGFFWLQERMTLRQWLGALVAITGSAIIAFQPGGDYLRWGALMILGSALLYSLHTAIVKRYGGEIDFINFFFFRIFITTVILGIGAAARGVLTWPAVNGWPIVLLAAAVDVILSRVLYYVALRRLRLNTHTILLTLSPVVTILWSLLLFDTLPGLQQLLGGAAVLTGVLLVTWPRR